jgi:hypothetical protein
MVPELSLVASALTGGLALPLPEKERQVAGVRIKVS